MPQRLFAPAAMATLLCLTTTAVLAQTSAGTPGTMSAEQGWSSIARCAQEDTERARHTCLDRVLREAGLLTEEMHARQQRRAFGLDDKPERTPTPPAPAPAAAATVAPSPAPAASSPIPAASSPTPAAPSPATAASPSASVAPPSATVAAPPAKAAPPAQPDRLEVELAAVEKAVDGRLYVTTTDGAVWLQTETVDMPQPPVKGDRMTIRKGSMGGYRCSVASTHLTYRCIRNR